MSSPSYDVPERLKPKPHGTGETGETGEADREATDPEPSPTSALTELAGVGPQRAASLARMGLETIRDLLVFVPDALERQGPRIGIEEAPAFLGRKVSVRGTLDAPRIFRQGRGRSVVSVQITDATGRIGLMFFNQPWALKALRARRDSGEEIEVYGRLVESKSGLALASPRIATPERPLPVAGSIAPVYPRVEGIGPGFLRDLLQAALAAHGAALEEPLGALELEPLQLPALPEALRGVHAPRSEEEFHSARRRLALEGVLAGQADLVRSREERARGRARTIELGPGARKAIERSLPHTPTAGQVRVMAEIVRDLARTQPMRRLLQGDVGAGKTLVAQYALASALSAGGQVAFLAPTELLAEQHQRALRGWLGELGFSCVLLTGSLPAAERRRALAGIASGATRVVIGTHALFSEGVAFRRLDLVVLDEQQRFGVEQKNRLLEKGRDVHLLLMSATPIPRTLALSIYGDLDVSILREKPPGRGELRTHFVARGKRTAMLGFLAERMAAGDRVFWVCPRIESDDDASDTGERDAEPLQAACDVHAELVAGKIARFGVELVHGRLAPEEREVRLERFRRGAAHLLVGTTVIEVGVDVPEATVMVIEGAERFGLAQLHQLRGRVGRGPQPAWCFLLGKESARDRLRTLEETADGFRIAEEDLRQRGMGDLAGVRQAGKQLDEESEGLADPITDLELMLFARALLEARPELLRVYGHHGLRGSGRGRPSPSLV